MRLDLNKVRENVRRASTEDLLDRVTVYRQGMEPGALAVIEEELRDRDITQRDITEHMEKRSLVTLPLADGTVAACSFCHGPAVAEGWGWHRLWGLLPVFPRFFRYCEAHLPGQR